MKRALWPTAPIVALGFWGGISAWQSPAVATRIQAGMAIVWGCHILFCLWVWHRAPPDSGDAMVMPMVLLVSASFLVGLVPRLLWPDAVGAGIAGSVASVIALTVLVIRELRRRRARRPSVSL